MHNSVLYNWYSSRESKPLLECMYKTCDSDDILKYEMIFKYEDELHRKGEQTKRHEIAGELSEEFDDFLGKFSVN